MVSVELKAVSKTWGGAAAVDEVSFTVEGGKLVALLGPSGCGKSTTLRLAILIGGRDVTRAEPSQRGIAMVFQNYALFPHLTVAQNIAFGLEVRKVPRAERDTRLARAADILGLEGLLDRKPSQLSGGQQQRVALGRAVVAEAPVCLMDEPLSNLDAQLRVEMRREIRELQQRLGITMVYVTHDQVEAMTMADQVVLMRNGRIEQDAPPDEIYENPASIFVARFVGTPPMNVLPLQAALAAGGAGQLTPPQGHDPATLAVGTRPEMTELGESGIAAEVVAVEYLGADTLVETRIGGHGFIVRRAGKVRTRPGETVYITLSQSALHWFDQASERKVASG